MVTKQVGMVIKLTLDYLAEVTAFEKIGKGERGGC